MFTDYEQPVRELKITAVMRDPRLTHFSSREYWMKEEVDELKEMQLSFVSSRTEVGLAQDQADSGPGEVRAQLDAPGSSRWVLLAKVAHFKRKRKDANRMLFSPIVTTLFLTDDADLTQSIADVLSLVLVVCPRQGGGRPRTMAMDGRPFGAVVASPLIFGHRNRILISEAYCYRRRCTVPFLYAPSTIMLPHSNHALVHDRDPFPLTRPQVLPNNGVNHDGNNLAASKSEAELSNQLASRLDSHNKHIRLTHFSSREYWMKEEVDELKEMQLSFVSSRTEVGLAQDQADSGPGEVRAQLDAPGSSRWVLLAKVAHFKRKRKDANRMLFSPIVTTLFLTDDADLTQSIADVLSLVLVVCPRQGGGRPRTMAMDGRPFGAVVASPLIFGHRNVAGLKTKNQMALLKENLVTA
ncbi:hypothetical protein BS47DRAFT_1394098 [Hydnum rufescens UP504]|uniref:Uncharacterized protein n=1 Tax=Hydnum rufescens UP504 TaxID=1448309 RepID=A0A9P6DST7_9AGAM|nr:hypothetical protein BS47DRAFT_1394098 [Hydnum rufescens UP504]